MIPYGYADGFDTEWCIHDVERPDYMLCSRRKGYLPVTPPLFPQLVHERCRAKWFRTGHVLPQVPRAEYGTCPDCSGDIPLEDGRITAHGAWVVGRHGSRVSDTPCSGEGELPEAGV